MGPLYNNKHKLITKTRDSTFAALAVEGRAVCNAIIFLFARNIPTATANIGEKKRERETTLYLWTWGAGLSRHTLADFRNSPENRRRRGECNFEKQITPFPEHMRICLMCVCVCGCTVIAVRSTL